MCVVRDPVGALRFASDRRWTGAVGVRTPADPRQDALFLSVAILTAKADGKLAENIGGPRGLGG